VRDGLGHALGHGLDDFALRELEVGDGRFGGVGPQYPRFAALVVVAFGLLSPKIAGWDDVGRFRAAAAYALRANTQIIAGDGRFQDFAKDGFHSFLGWRIRASRVSRTLSIAGSQ
jgi:hypothetical protein